MLQWLRDAIALAEALVAVDEGGTKRLPAGNVSGEEAATSRPRQL